MGFIRKSRHIAEREKWNGGHKINIVKEVIPFEANEVTKQDHFLGRLLFYIGETISNLVNKGRNYKFEIGKETRRHNQ